MKAAEAMDSLERTEALLEAARSGDDAAFSVLLGEKEPALRRFLRRLLGTSSSEDDILQNAFLALYANLDRLEGASHLMPFLYRVTRNLAYDELRRRGRYTDEEFDEADAEPLPLRCGWASTEDAVEWTLIAAEVDAAMLRLPEVQRQALILYGQEGLSYEQVAEATGADMGTVKSRIFYARRRLRQLLHTDTLEALGLSPDTLGRSSK